MFITSRIQIYIETFKSKDEPIGEMKRDVFVLGKI